MKLLMIVTALSLAVLEVSSVPRVVGSNPQYFTVTPYDPDVSCEEVSAHGGDTDRFQGTLVDARMNYQLLFVSSNSSTIQ